MGVARVSELAKWLNLSELSPLGGAGRSATPSCLLEVRSFVCVFTRAGLPGLTSTYSGGHHDKQQLERTPSLGRMPQML